MRVLVATFGRLLSFAKPMKGEPVSLANNGSDKPPLRVMKVHFSAFAFSFLVLTGLCSCEWGDAGVGASLTPNPDVAQQQVIDTFTVQTATVLLDSFSTTSATRLLIGQYQDAYLGMVKSGSFCQIDLANSFKPATEAVFDSLTLSLRYDYHYGDTTQYQQISVYPLSSRLDETETYYNTSSVPYATQPLARHTFRARPGTGKRLEIRLSDALGRSIFQEAKQGNLTTNEDLLNLLKGIALFPSGSGNTAMLGYLKDSLKTNLYYHQTGTNGDVQSVLEWKAGYWFNQITSDRNQTALAALQQPLQSIATASTNQQVFLQGGVALGVRIDLPTIQQLRSIPNSGINSAILTLRAIPNTVSRTYPLPSSLSVYACDTKNRLVSYLPPSYSGSTSPQVVGYSTDPGTGESIYKLDLTEYVNNIVRSTSTQWNGLMILPAQQTNELSRAIIGGNKHKTYAMKLDVYYAVFRSN